ncbi:hypothetical protein HOY82DRAFT_672050 [Tuber indicum]|nr:hypothetical protein HOY82DRAFT_672050 [Tuber indicum]
MPPLNSEQIIYEQNTNLQAFSREIIAVATPTPQELATQNQHLKKCRAIRRRICLEGELVPFGRLVTGFAITKSDLGAVLVTSYPEAFFNTPDMSDESNSLPHNQVKEFQSKGFEVTLLFKTSVPIMKSALKVTDENTFYLSCDIGFNHDLGVHNTRNLQTYSRYDPRIKEMVLFIKWWAKRRHINSPYRGTLSSYGYALMIIHFLINVVDPPVSINLQNTPIPEDVPPDQIFDKAGEEWAYSDKRWILAIEGPFEISGNVGRSCNSTGVDRIRSEFKRALNIIRFRDGGKSMRELLCQEGPPEKPWVRREDVERMEVKSNLDQSANKKTNETVKHQLNEFGNPISGRLGATRELSPNIS